MCGVGSPEEVCVCTVLANEDNVCVSLMRLENMATQIIQLEL